MARECPFRQTQWNGLRALSHNGKQYFSRSSRGRVTREYGDISNFPARIALPVFHRDFRQLYLPDAISTLNVGARSSRPLWRGVDTPRGMSASAKTPMAWMPERPMWSGTNADRRSMRG
jgi:hypothetical protein